MFLEALKRRDDRREPEDGGVRRFRCSQVGNLLNRLSIMFHGAPIKVCQQIREQLGLLNRKSLDFFNAARLHCNKKLDIADLPLRAKVNEFLAVQLFQRSGYRGKEIRFDLRHVLARCQQQRLCKQGLRLSARILGDELTKVLYDVLRAVEVSQNVGDYLLFLVKRNDLGLENSKRISLCDELRISPEVLWFRILF